VKGRAVRNGEQTCSQLEGRELLTSGSQLGIVVIAPLFGAPVRTEISEALHRQTAKALKANGLVSL